MKQYIISPEASLDLSEIIDYFTARNIESGENLMSLKESVNT